MLFALAFDPIFVLAAIVRQPFGDFVKSACCAALVFSIRVELHELPDVEFVHSVLTARLDEEAFAFWGDRDGRDHVVGAKAAMQFPEMAAAFAYLFKASGHQLAPDAPATQSLSRSIGNEHCRFPFSAELVESKSRTYFPFRFGAAARPSFINRLMPSGRPG
jgi:hypothetical protein